MGQVIPPRLISFLSTISTSTLASGGGISPGSPTFTFTPVSGTWYFIMASETTDPLNTSTNWTVTDTNNNSYTILNVTSSFQEAYVLFKATNNTAISVTLGSVIGSANVQRFGYGVVQLS